MEIKQIKIQSDVTQEEPDIRFVSADSGQYIDVTSIEMDGYKIKSITDSDGKVYDRSQIVVKKNFILAEGLGYVPDATVVRYKNKDYFADYGWHTNSSNQTIKGWYLSSIYNPEDVTEVVPKTLYKDMTKELEEVKFCL